VPQDYAEAHMWYNLAVSRASGDDQKKYAEARDIVAEIMTPQQIAEAQRRAREWKPNRLRDETLGGQLGLSSSGNRPLSENNMRSGTVKGIQCPNVGCRTAWPMASDGQLPDVCSYCGWPLDVSDLVVIDSLMPLSEDLARPHPAAHSPADRRGAAPGAGVETEDRRGQTRGR
jgi:hypothetical protein